MISMTIRSVPEKKRQNVVDAWDAEWEVSDMSWSATAGISGNRLKKMIVWNEDRNSGNVKVSYEKKDDIKIRKLFLIQEDRK